MLPSFVPKMKRTDSWLNLTEEKQNKILEEIEKDDSMALTYETKNNSEIDRYSFKNSISSSSVDFKPTNDIVK